MKTYYTLATFILVNFLSFSQSHKILIEYEAKTPYFTNNEALIANNKKAIYISDALFIEKESNIIKEEDDNKFSVLPKEITLNSATYFLKSEDNIIYFTQSGGNERSIIQDNLPDFNWDTSHHETKKIGEFSCNKATTRFRGTEIVVWYAEEINIPFGPWKFKGLPGLILEAYSINDTHTKHWSAKKITYPYQKEVDFEYDTNLSTIKYETVVKDEDKEIREIQRRTISKSPRGVISMPGKINRLGIEKEYEWEN